MHAGGDVRVVSILAIDRRGARKGGVCEAERIDGCRRRQRDRHAAVRVATVAPSANGRASERTTVLRSQSRSAGAIADAGIDEDGPIAHLGDVVTPREGDRGGRVVLEVNIQIRRPVVVEQDGRGRERRAVLAQVDGEKREAETARCVICEAREAACVHGRVRGRV